MSEGSFHTKQNESSNGAFKRASQGSVQAYAGASVDDADTGTLSELKETLQLLASVTERRAERLSAKAQLAMRDYPWTTVAVAGLAGAAIAVVAIPSSTKRARSRHSLPRLADVEWPQVSLRSIPAAAPQLPTRADLAKYAERAADAISRVDPNAFTSERLSGLGDVVRTVWSKLVART